MGICVLQGSRIWDFGIMTSKSKFNHHDATFVKSFFLGLQSASGWKVTGALKAPQKLASDTWYIWYMIFLPTVMESVEKNKTLKWAPPHLHPLPLTQNNSLNKSFLFFNNSPCSFGKNLQFGFLLHHLPLKALFLPLSQFVWLLPLLEFLFHSPFHDTSVWWTPGKISQPYKEIQTSFQQKEWKLLEKETSAKNGDNI